MQDGQTAGSNVFKTYIYGFQKMYDMGFKTCMIWVQKMYDMGFKTCMIWVSKHV